MMEALVLILIACGAAFGLYCYLWSIPTLEIFGPALIRGPVEGRRVALTFDDGPTRFTEQILDILRDRNVRATFFVCGRNAERYPQILSRIQKEGHAIGNHTYSHPFPYFHRRRFFASQIDRTQEAIARVTGQRPTIFRPPYGARWVGLYPVLGERGLRLINWSDTGYDWLEKSDIARETMKNLGPGSIILLHDGKNDLPSEQVDRSRTVSALPAIIDAARAAGLTFVPVTDFLD
ncbi:MAG: polysaccharide deacetylase family protein [Terriglobia bacterium]|jgi:peptidoglycan/xylan/chitin deacetylase (PgdA/CDA1 family)